MAQCYRLPYASAMRRVLPAIALLSLAFAGCHAARGVAATSVPAPAPAPAAQNPSPMQERTRRHERLTQQPLDGISLRIDSVLPKPVDLFIPRQALGQRDVPLVIHFMGATWVPQTAAASMQTPVIIAATYLGGGSGVYARPFAADSLLYGRLVAAIRSRLAAIPQAPRINRVVLSGWSAGYGAIREILRVPSQAAAVNGVLLLDGLHTSYRPDGKPLADGGELDTLNLAPFAAFARRAMRGETQMLITHSEIFPGTFASTTECSDWLLQSLGLARTPVLEWGPLGTQLLSRTTRGGFTVLGFAGNTAPDHIDLFHGMATWLTPLVGAR